MVTMFMPWGSHSSCRIVQFNRSIQIYIPCRGMRPSAGFRGSKKKKEKKIRIYLLYSADVPNVLYARKCMDHRMQTFVGFPMMVFSADGMQNRGRYNVASTCALRPTIVSPHTPRTYNHSFQIPNQQAPPQVYIRIVYSSPTSCSLGDCQLGLSYRDNNTPSQQRTNAWCRTVEDTAICLVFPLNLLQSTIVRLSLERGTYA